VSILKVLPHIDSSYSLHFCESSFLVFWGKKLDVLSTIINIHVSYLQVWQVRTVRHPRVQQTLSQAGDLNLQARDLVYTSLIDSAVEYCHLPTWNQWTYGPLEPPAPRWSLKLPDDFITFRLKVIRTDFPGTLTELERAVKTLSILLCNAANVFQRHYEIRDDGNGNLYYQGQQFYKIPYWDTEKYNQLSAEFDDWVEKCPNQFV